ncbi:DUF2493 domain-containing protein [Roseovarius sp.]|uniref:DUF2493 domain-containing protein n=1 Tax=Roseovarius sp. TaxID=1486281 RepID=UPI003BAAD3E5
MRVLVCGGRNYSDAAFLEAGLNVVHDTHNVTRVIHGAASGADRLAGEWAKGRGIPQIACPAAWDKYGRAAGPMRNQYMIDVHKPDLLVAFPGGKGTADMIAKARKAGVRVVIAEPPQ